MDFVRIDYTARVKDGPVFDTTDAENARKEKVFDSKRVYRPMPVIVGEGQVVKGLEEALASMAVGEEKTVELSPDKAFGPKDPEMVRLVPIKYFKQQGLNPIPGMPVELDGRHARIQTVAGGRVRVDFNHELAGKTVVYSVKVVSKAASDNDKANFLVERSFNDAEGFAIAFKGKDVSLDLPEKVFMDRNLTVRKASLSAEFFKYLDASSVTYTESWKSKKAGGKKEGESEEKKE
ncbi:MAG: peptidylprolyl isomerase [Candidatus Altiarchaeota archaeon]|nr:peptidylprolyl isomerase [Candidatus Altiarchaeota archaeon]